MFALDPNISTHPAAVLRHEFNSLVCDFVQIKSLMERWGVDGQFRKNSISPSSLRKLSPSGNTYKQGMKYRMRTRR